MYENEIYEKIVCSVLLPDRQRLHITFVSLIPNDPGQNIQINKEMTIWVLLAYIL